MISVIAHPVLSPSLPQVSQLNERIEEDRSREHEEIDATTKALVDEAERELVRLRARLDKMEADLRAARERERQAVEATARLQDEMLVGRDGTARAEAALTTALERAHAAEATADVHSRANEAAAEREARAAETARQDKETLKRGLVAAQAQAAELRAENSRLLVELEHAAATASSLGRSGGLGDAATAVAEAVEEAVAEASEAAVDTATAGAHRVRVELEDRLALALAEAAEARTAVQRLKSKLKTYERGHKTALAATSRQGAGRLGQTTSARRESEGSPCELCDAKRRTLREACEAMDRVAAALSSAVDRADPHAGGGGSDLDDPRWTMRTRRGRDASRAPHAPPPPSGRLPRRRRAFSADSKGNGERGDADYDGEDDAWERGLEGSEGRISRTEVRETLERLRSEAARLLAFRRDERKAVEGDMARVQAELRNAEGREAETAARLEESREV